MKAVINFPVFLMLAIMSVSVTCTCPAKERSEVQILQQEAPQPIVVMAGKSTGTMGVNEILGSGGLSLVSPYDTLFVITSFVLTRVRQGETPVELKNGADGRLTPEMKKLIASTRNGDKLYFEYIKCRARDGSIRSLRALSFVVE